MRYTPSRAKMREFSAKMDAVQDYCDNNAIDYSASSDSYYFNHGGKSYRISNHTTAASNAGAYQGGEQVRPLYHTSHYDVEIFAGKTRLIEIHKNIIAGITLDKRGNIKY